MSEELNMTPKQTLAFFASVIKSGEPWTGTCQKAYDEAMAALTPAAEEKGELIKRLQEMRNELHVNELRNSGSADGNIYSRWGSIVSQATIALLLSSPRVEEILKIVDEFRPPQPEDSEFAKGANFAARQIYAAIAALSPQGG